MHKIRAAVMASTVLGALAVGMPSASAAPYRLEDTYKAVSGSCTVWQDRLFDLASDGDFYQQGHAQSANGHRCGYIQLALREGGSWTVDFSPPLWSSGGSGWAPLAPDSSGEWVKGCVTDYTAGSIESCTPAE